MYINIIILLLPIIPSCLIGYVVHRLIKHRIKFYSSYYTNSLDWVAIPSIFIMIAGFSYVMFMDIFFLAIGLVCHSERETFVGVFSIVITIAFFIWSINRSYSLSKANRRYYLVKTYFPKEFIHVDDTELSINLNSNIIGFYFRLEQYGQVIGIIDKSFLFENKCLVNDFLSKTGHSLSELKN